MCKSVYSSSPDKLVVQSVELHKDKNKAAHRTNSFKHDGLIIRRGQVFTLTVTFDRAYTPTDKVILEFTIGKFRCFAASCEKQPKGRFLTVLDCLAYNF